jgi:hypothetical protein
MSTTPVPGQLYQCVWTTGYLSSHGWDTLNEGATFFILDFRVRQHQQAGANPMDPRQLWSIEAKVITDQGRVINMFLYGLTSPHMSNITRISVP